MAKKPHVADAAIAAALALAAERGWRSLSLADIAERAQLPLADLAERFPSKAALLDAYFRSVDSRMLAAGPEPGEVARDRLFEVLMRRFEAMAPDRHALMVILRESGDDPLTLFCGARRFLRSMALALEAAGLSSSGLGGMARLEGLMGIYLYVLRAFLGDDTPDLTRTMATLDKALRRAEGIASLLWTRRDVRPRAHTTVEGGV
ncbi:MAG: TetR family transcriptional regulator [Magnetospirillum sp.]|nr:TetR family transcriptional regulator [Magnetospirillum sp.]